MDRGLRQAMSLVPGLLLLLRKMSYEGAVLEYTTLLRISR